jgi:hypothetical protein
MLKNYKNENETHIMLKVLFNPNPMTKKRLLILANYGSLLYQLFSKCDLNS